MTAQTILHAEIGNVSTHVLWTDLVHLLPSVRLLITTLCALVLMVSLALHILDVLRVSLPAQIIHEIYVNVLVQVDQKSCFGLE